MELITIIENLIEEHGGQGNLARTLGIKQSQISEWKKGKCKPSYDMLKLIATKLSLSGDFLLGLEDEFGNRI